MALGLNIAVLMGFNGDIFVQKGAEWEYFVLKAQKRFFLKK